MSEKQEAKEKSAGGGLDRRRFMAYFSGAGLAATAFPSALWAQAEEEGKITKEMVQAAEKLSGLEFTDAERELMLEGLNENLESFEKLRGVAIENSVAPALFFNPIPAGVELPAPVSAVRRCGTPGVGPMPGGEDLAFLPVTHLAEYIRTGQIKSVDLTRLYLERLKKYDPDLHCVVSLTEERAMQEAERADREIAAGNYRGPLHGIPWGAKDLLAAQGYKTTWGAMPYKDQVIDEDAEVVRRLTEAGAVLTAKLTLGALAWGDVWFGGTTRNPWNTEQGSSGSSAGSASATAAGLVGFAVGSETWGSIVSPCTRCGATGLRPTFGRVSRRGAMALSWSMDKLGPLCRSVEDCALVFEAIYGPDGKDLTVIDHPFVWNDGLDITKLRIGYVKSVFEKEPEAEEDRKPDMEWYANDLKALDDLRSMGVDLIPIELPDLPVSALSFILKAEAAAAFDELTRSNRDDLLVRQIKNAWPNVFRQSRFIPAVEYIQANRARSILMQQMAEILKDIDVYVCPSYGGDNLLLTNLTGHPAVVLPNGFRSDGTPTSITFNGQLFGEDRLLAVARIYQEATGFHRKRPPIKPIPKEGGLL
jgi:Asp-tRNA(Asn)/Glu-tRNA(Gln) amidotransferase A subunit family amidase